MINKLIKTLVPTLLAGFTFATISSYAQNLPTFTLQNKTTHPLTLKIVNSKQGTCFTGTAQPGNSITCSKKCCNSADLGGPPYQCMHVSVYVNGIKLTRNSQSIQGCEFPSLFTSDVGKGTLTIRNLKITGNGATAFCFLGSYSVCK